MKFQYFSAQEPTFSTRRSHSNIAGGKNWSNNINQTPAWSDQGVTKELAMFANSQLPRALMSCAREWRGGALRGRRMCSAATEAVRPPKARGNSAFVKRRQTYRHRLHDIRVAFQAEAAKNAETSDDAEVVDVEGMRSEREKWKRERFIARQEAHEKHMAKIQEVKLERKAFRKQTWMDNKKRDEEAKLKVIERLNKEADNWMTEESMERDVEKVVNEFFIVGARAQREVREMVE